MAIEQIMSTDLVTVEPDDTLRLVNEIFEHVPFHHLLVVENGKLFGVLSDRDLLKSLSPSLGTAQETYKDLAILNKKVHQFMTRKPVTLNPGASVYAAVQVFNQYKISCIPVVNESFKPLGILTWRDILKAIEQRYCHSER